MMTTSKSLSACVDEDGVKLLIEHSSISGNRKWRDANRTV
jgi:hypothetical protein